MSSLGAEDSSSSLGYLRTAWTVSNGSVGGSINAIAEADGYLWLGTERGLFRFDGREFRLYSNSEYPEIAPTPVMALVSDREGQLWIKAQDANLVRYRRGKFESFRTNLPTENGATVITRGNDGRLLVAGVGTPLREDGGRLLPVAEEQIPFSRLAVSMAESTDGTVWIGTRDAGLYGIRQGQMVSPKGLPDLKINCLLPGANGVMWIGTDAGLVMWADGAILRNKVSLTLGRAQILSMLRDGAGNLWLGTNSGIIRIDASERVDVINDSEHSASPVTVLFEDRERNIWAGGAGGLERFTERPFRSFALPDVTNAGGPGPIFVDARGRAWLGMSGGGVFLLDPNSGRANRVRELGREVVYSIDGSADGIWIGKQQGGVAHVSWNGRRAVIRNFGRESGLAAGSVWAVREAGDGSVWVATIGGGVSRIANGRVTTFTTRNGLNADTIHALEVGANGRVWAATPNGLNTFDGRLWKAAPVSEGLPPGRINCLFVDGDGVLWIGSDAGLAAIRDGIVHSAPAVPKALHDQVLGIAGDGQGGLWVATASHVVRISRKAVLGDDAKGEGLVHEFGEADGIRAAGGVRRHRSVTSGPDGRIWFSFFDAVAAVNPSRFSGAPVPPLLRLRSVTADGVRLESSSPIQVPPGSRRISFAFEGLSLAAPEQVHFRYRLDDFDAGWSDSSSTGEALYTNLSPGNYSFRVIAGNREGIWNSEETSVALQVLPHYWESWWFRISVLAASVFGVILLYRWRLQRITTRLHDRFEERLGERTRIAQELHDTLLQGFLSASMHLDVMTESVPTGSPLRARLDRTRELVREVVIEGRNAVVGLRGVQEDRVLSEALAKLGEQLADAEATQFRVIVEGRERWLNPLIRDDVYRIGREAIANAFRHASATVVEAELHYAERGIHLVVRDDGKGIEQIVLDHGKGGHWGLTGMQERATRIGGKLKIFSRPGGGTEVDLSLPGSIAFSAAGNEPTPVQPLRRVRQLYSKGLRRKAQTK